MARIKVSPSQAGRNRWEVFCDGRLVGPSMSREQAFYTAQRLEAGEPCSIHPLTTTR
jgi:hypothetical protein